MFKKLLLIWIFTVCLVGLGQAQNDFQNTEFKVHTIYIYNFTKYITWPSDYNKGDFVIGVVGETKLVAELKKMSATKSVAGRKIEVKKFANLEEVQGHCHILILPTTASDLLSNVMRNNTKGTLIITQKPGLAKIGSAVNFVSVGGKPRFELNVQSIDRLGLRVASPLKSIAIVV